MEINGNGLLNLLRGESENQLLDQMDVTFALDDKLIELNLKKNRNVPANAPVFVAEYGEIVEWKASEATVSNRHCRSQGPRMWGGAPTTCPAATMGFLGAS